MLFSSFLSRESFPLKEKQIEKGRIEWDLCWVCLGLGRCNCDWEAVSFLISFWQHMNKDIIWHPPPMLWWPVLLGFSLGPFLCSSIVVCFVFYSLVWKGNHIYVVLFIGSLCIWFILSQEETSTSGSDLEERPQEKWPTVTKFEVVRVIFMVDFCHWDFSLIKKTSILELNKSPSVCVHISYWWISKDEWFL